MSNDSTITLLKRFSPFDDLDEQYLQRIAEHSEYESVGAGKLIFQRGKRLTHRFYLVAGTVDLLDSGFVKTSLSASDEPARFTLDDSAPTRMSAVAHTDVELLRVDAEFLDVAMAWSQGSASSSIESGPSELESVDLSVAHVEVVEDDTDWMSALLQSPLFIKVSPVHIQSLLAKFISTPVKQGDVVIKEGEAGDFFYVIDKGSARVTNLMRQLDVSLGAGDFFGEEALVGDAPRNASVVMTSDGSLMKLGKSDFKELLQQPVQQFITVEELQAKPVSSYQLIDVRLPIEFRHLHVADARNVSLTSLRDKISGMNSEILYVITDDAGRRSQVAAYLMCQLGFSAVILEKADQLYG